MESSAPRSPSEDEDEDEEAMSVAFDDMAGAAGGSPTVPPWVSRVVGVRRGVERVARAGFTVDSRPQNRGRGEPIDVDIVLTHLTRCHDQNRTSERTRPQSSSIANA